MGMSTQTSQKLTLYSLLEIFRGSQVNSCLIVTVDEGWVSPMAQQQRTDLSPTRHTGEVR